jgi:uncharacterized SAM-binding protein YcdF (DUF218 family)
MFFSKKSFTWLIISLALSLGLLLAGSFWFRFTSTFFLKKAISRLLFPLPVCFVFLLMGLFFLWFSKKQKVGKVLVTLGVLLLGLLSNHSFANLLLYPLELAHPSLLEPELLNQDRDNPVKWVVVLSGSFNSDSVLPLSARPGNVTLTRFMEGVGIYKKLRGAKLVLTVQNGEDDSGSVMAKLARLLGVEDEDFMVETGGRDTDEEMELIRRTVGQDRFVLVTSASHMPRAVILFRAKGMNPHLAPTDYLVTTTQDYWLVLAYPSLDALKKSERAFYEYLGLAWMWVRS